ncbi:GH116 family glycosyl-hydrolase [Streptomyces sp. 4N509B]|uniref:GH116 family glycosyl-hydrolase n=1 Tax=Streptomyces sp. 4N509B TaxID=3457413 RepID=UPI003FD2D8C2
MPTARPATPDGAPAGTPPRPSPPPAFWPVPDCAWRRRLGDRPAAALRVEEHHSGRTTPDRTKRGIPLGGIGAGGFMLNLCGSFGPWNMKPGRLEERFLPQAAFHVRERIGDAPATARTLATEDVLPAWPRLAPGDGEYAALFPQGWCAYEPFATALSLRFFSPVIRERYEESALPVAVFLLRAHNRRAERARLSFMFTFPNATYTDPEGLARRERANEIMFDLPGADDPLVCPRTGLVNEPATDAAGEVTAVLLRANDPANPVETEGTAWAVATAGVAGGAAGRGTVTAVPCWDGAGDGAALWRDFAEDGRLDPDVSGAASTLPAAALAVAFDLDPGETAVVPFVLAWEFPLVEFAGGTRWRRRHADRDAAEPARAVELARRGLASWERWLADVEAWTTPIAEDPRVPTWLRQGALNELFYTTFGGSFWENGCVTRPKRFGARPGQHLHFVLEAQDYPYAETYDVRHHVAAAYRELWPAIERDVQLGYADFVMDTPDGSVPHDAGSPHGDPWFAYDAYATMYPYGEGDTARRTTPWGEFSPKFVQQVHAHWVASGDDAFLDACWPALLRTYHYQRTTDVNDDGLSEMKSSEYRDNRLFNAVLWLGALAALEAMAKARGEHAVAREVGAERARAREAAERELWDAEHGYYWYNAATPDLMADAFLGQRYADATGLPPLLDPARVASHLRRCQERLVQPFGGVGAANVRRPDGSPSEDLSEFHHEREVWLGVSYVLAATMVHWGRRAADPALEQAGLRLGRDVWHRVWQDDTTGYWFGAPEAWEVEDPTRCRVPMYQRARAVWELLDAVRAAGPPPGVTEG